MPKTAKKRLKSRWTSEPILTKIKKSVESRLCGNLLWRGWPTFLEKKVEKQGKWGIMKIENAVNTVVEPYLWVIETLFQCHFLFVHHKLNRTYEWLKHKSDDSRSYVKSAASYTVPMRDNLFLLNVLFFMNTIIYFANFQRNI